MNILLLFLSFTAAPVDCVVVCPPALRPALQPWIDYRQKQGHMLAVIDSRNSAAAIREKIIAQYKAGGLKSVVIVGDTSPKPIGDETTTPTFFVKAKVNVIWGSEPTIASDHHYSDMTGDGSPEVTVGRLPADNATELKTLIDKIIRYEQSAPLGEWRRKIHFTTGVGDFGIVADTIIETATKKLLTDEIPPAYDTSLMHASWRSPYFPNPYNFRNKTKASLNDGGLFWVYIGHGSRHRLDYVRTPSDRGLRMHFPILGNKDVVDLNNKGKSPIAMFLACYTGAYDDPTDSLAEQLMKQPGGPIATIAGSRVTMPYAMTVMARGMMHEFFVHKRPTLGEVVMHSKRQLVGEGRGDDTAKLIDALAVAVNPLGDDLKAERTEHLYLFNILGDPLLRLPTYRELPLKIEPVAYAGEKLTIGGSSPISGELTLELAVRRDRLKTPIPARSKFEFNKSALVAMDRQHEQANDKIVWSRKFATQVQDFETTIDLPKDAGGPYVVRAFVKGETEIAIGGVSLVVRKR